jgi:hypothetical protein
MVIGEKAVIGNVMGVSKLAPTTIELVVLAKPAASANNEVFPELRK